MSGGFMAWIMCPSCKQRIDYEWSMGTPTVCPHCRSDIGAGGNAAGAGLVLGFVVLAVLFYFGLTWLWDWFTQLEWYWKAVMGFVVVGLIAAPILAQIEDNNG